MDTDHIPVVSPDVTELVDEFFVGSNVVKSCFEIFVSDVFLEVDFKAF